MDRLKNKEYYTRLELEARISELTSQCSKLRTYNLESLSRKDKDNKAAIENALIAERKRAHKQDNDYLKSLARHIDALEEDNTRLSESNKKLSEGTLIQGREINYLEEQLHIKSIELSYFKSNSNTALPEERVETLIEYRVGALEERVEELEQSQ